MLSQHLKCGHLRVSKYNSSFDSGGPASCREQKEEEEEKRLRGSVTGHVTSNVDNFLRFDKYPCSFTFYHRSGDFGFIEIWNQISTTIVYLAKFMVCKPNHLCWMTINLEFISC